MTRSPKRPSFAALVQEFFGNRLIQQQNVSAHTVASYRDTFRLLLRYFQKRYRKEPTTLAMEDFDAPVLLAFLNDLEKHRKNSVRTRNARLAALRSFMKYAQARDPSILAIAQRVLAIPAKRFHRPLLGYLTREEVAAITAAPPQETWSGRRDRALLTVLYNTGARVSEVIGLRRTDVTLGPSRAVRIRGKGRKMSRSGVEDRLEQALVIAIRTCPSLRGKTVSPHTMRHSTAMHLLQSDVSESLIALWLGHESSETTHQYVQADLTMKQRALDRMNEPSVQKGRFRAKENLLKFLDGL